MKDMHMFFGKLMKDMHMFFERPLLEGSLKHYYDAGGNYGLDHCCHLGFSGIAYCCGAFPEPQ